MPILFRIRGITFSFYSSDHPPTHLHVRAAGRSAKIEVATGRVIYNRGFHTGDMRLIRKLIYSNREFIQECWNDYFKEKD